MQASWFFKLGEVPDLWPFRCSHLTSKPLLRVIGQYPKDQSLVSLRQPELSKFMAEQRAVLSHVSDAILKGEPVKEGLAGIYSQFRLD